MQAVGHPRFAVVGHDRGAYTAFRMAMDHPHIVTHLAVLDAVPILEALERCTAEFARRWWHWFFYAQADRPERAILANPDTWYGGSTMAMGQYNYADYRTAIHDPRVVRGMLDDNRAGLAIDHVHDADDRREARRVMCPTLALWSTRDDLPDLCGDVLEVWRPSTTGLAGGPFESTTWPKTHRNNSRRTSSISCQPSRAVRASSCSPSRLRRRPTGVSIARSRWATVNGGPR